MTPKTEFAIETALTTLRSLATWNDTLGDATNGVHAAIKALEAAKAEQSAPIWERPEPLFRRIASAVAARANCEKRGNLEWFDRHESDVESYCREYLPSGGGFDCGTKINWDRSNGARLVFETEFHHMDSNGFYDGWTQHTVTVTPSFDGFDLRISGRDRNGIKEYIAESFHHSLSRPVEHIRSRDAAAERAAAAAAVAAAH